MAKNIVIIGAVALGPKTACRLKRLRPEDRVTMIDRDSLVSYGGCGIPYFISGDVADASQLQSTSFHMVRDEKFFRQAKDVEVLTRTEALSIDRAGKTVLVRNLETGEENRLPYDKLVLAAGARPRKLGIPGEDLEGVFTIADLNRAIRIKEMIASGKVGRAVVVGGGAIGIEMVEALSDLWGIDTALVEIRDQLLPGVVGPELARMVQAHLAEKGVEEVYLEEKVQSIDRAEDGSLTLATDRRTLAADLIVVAAGLTPNSELARTAGLALTQNGAVQVNSRFQTSDPDIYAGGDCIENMHLVTGRTVYMPSGSLANRHGRIIGTNLSGAIEEFDGVVGSFIMKCFDLAVGAVGLSLARARAEGFDAFSTLIVQGDRAHFYPGMDLMYLELVADRATGRVLGLQGLSGVGEALSARINAVAGILKYKPLLRDISNLELAYAPPYAAAMDVLNALANTAENVLAGKCRTIGAAEFAEMVDREEKSDFVCLDVRGWANAEPFVRKHPEFWINIPQDELKDRLDEVPRDKELILVCNSGVRSYEAQVALDRLEIGPCRNLEGGIAAIKKRGLKIV